MLVTVKLRHLKITPRKTRLVADAIRGKSVEQAQAILRFTIKKAAVPILKLLKSAVASAKNNFQLQESSLYIAKIVVDGGPKQKRWRPRSRGQAARIEKRTSHVTIVISDDKKVPGKNNKKEKNKALPVSEKNAAIKKTASASRVKNKKAINKKEK